VAVDATVARRAGTTVVVRLQVTDTGIGVPEDRQSNIFESFTQADESTNRMYGGTGLGLSICRDPGRLMGRRIGLDSTPGRGSTCWFEIPLAWASPAVAA